MCEKITLIENGKILSNDEEIAECYNYYFTNITDSLDIDPLLKVVHEQQTIDQMVLRVIDKYKDHPSIVVIKQHVRTNYTIFEFSHVSPTKVMKQIDLLNNNKTSSWNIPTTLLKATREIEGYRPG